MNRYTLTATFTIDEITAERLAKLSKQMPKSVAVRKGVELLFEQKHGEGLTKIGAGRPRKNINSVERDANV